MKTNFLLVLILACGFSFISAQQLENGTYVYTNAKGVVCTINSSNNGWDVSVNLNLGKDYSGRVVKARGGWRKVNVNGADPGYDGPGGWYEANDGNCNLDFDATTKELTLRLADCQKNGVKNMDLKLTRKFK